MLFGIVNGVGRGMGALDCDRRREGAVLRVNLGHPIVTSGDSDTLFPNYFGGIGFVLAYKYFCGCFVVYHRQRFFHTEVVSAVARSR